MVWIINWPKLDPETVSGTKVLSIQVSRESHLRSSTQLSRKLAVRVKMIGWDKDKHPQLIQQEKKNVSSRKTTKLRSVNEMSSCTHSEWETDDNQGIMIKWIKRQYVYYYSCLFLHLTEGLCDVPPPMLTTLFDRFCKTRFGALAYGARSGYVARVFSV